ncbi:acyl-CoA dehydrogenase family protein [Orrella daihaiensis]|uniref:Acyl-CoA dehydrogenase family protein n=1 Tax=Orrella daihaiensis TaxID=2782176 RepID=A0ABY4AGT9_9BURK|nr:acyl-CoA dehydrogenase family protein [Orrella daihaiensis]UOD49502.1 acyl-CoA dehydrogenase family protein [Orrella daihaiensis]
MNAPLPTTLATASFEHPVPDRAGANAFIEDPEFAPLLQLYLPHDLAKHLHPHLLRLGELAGDKLDQLARTADLNPPELEHRSRSGLDQQRIVKHPAYIEMEQLAFGEFGLAAMSHRAGVLGWDSPLPAAAKYALTYLFVQAEFGLCCPLSMTDSLTRTLKKYGTPELVQRYFDDLTSQDLDTLAQGAMFMTEQGAGSDVSATQTVARTNPDEPDGAWRLFGDKWFCSNPDAALAMVLARTEGAPAGMKGVSLFLLPRILPDGTPNTYRIIRLKDKMGTRSMASGEIRLEGAKAWLVGELGRGFAQMADMVNNSRLSNGMRAAGLMRRAVAEAVHFSRHRVAFGKRLIEMPLMQRQLAKLMVPAEQARTMMFQTAEALRRSDADIDGAYALTRLLTPLIKFRACRDARKVTGDAMEVRGGCGYIEEWGDARIVRDAHLGSIWEGTSNIVALDVMRAIEREDSLPIWREHLIQLLQETAWHEQVDSRLHDLVDQVYEIADDTARQKNEVMARQVASALYHLTSVVAMGWEATQTGSFRRMLLAQLALVHRLMPNDPLGKSVDVDLQPLFDQDAPSVSRDRLENINLLG